MNSEKDFKAKRFKEERFKEIAKAVNHPSHYLKDGKECIDVMIDKYGVKAVINFCECNQFKYEWRAGLKKDNSREQDLAKANWYKNKAEELKALDNEGK